jgi:hypothetical protein
LATVRFWFALKRFSMEIVPNLKTTRVPQLDPGDLFMVRDDTGSYVAYASRSRTTAIDWYWSLVHLPPKFLKLPS